MQTLLNLATDYARSQGYELVVVDGPAVDRYVRLTVGVTKYLVIDAGTAKGSTCGEVVYRACSAPASTVVSIRRVETPQSSLA